MWRIFLAWLLVASKVASFTLPDKTFSTIYDIPEKQTRPRVLLQAVYPETGNPLLCVNEELGTQLPVTLRQKYVWSRLSTMKRKMLPGGRRFTNKRRRISCFIVATMAYLRGPLLGADFDPNVAHAGVTFKVSSLKVKATVNSNPDLLFPAAAPSGTQNRAVTKKSATKKQNIILKKDRLAINSKHLSNQMISGGSIVVAAAGGILVGKLARNENVRDGTMTVSGPPESPEAIAEAKKQQMRSESAEKYITNALKQQENTTALETTEKQVQNETKAEVIAKGVEDVGSLESKEILKEQQNTTLLQATKKSTLNETMDEGTRSLEAPVQAPVEQEGRPLEPETLYFVKIDNQKESSRDTDPSPANATIKTASEPSSEADAESSSDNMADSVLPATKEPSLNSTTPEEIETHQTTEKSEDTYGL